MKMKNHSCDEWRDVVGFNGAYKVSFTGKVINTKTGKHLSGSAHNKGYTMMTFMRDGVPVRMFLHKVVAAAFIGERREGFIIDHIDGDKRNNVASNLRYVTPKENVHAAMNAGLFTFGHKNGQSKLTPEQLDEIREARSSGVKRWGAKILAKKYGVDYTTVSRAARLLTYKDAIVDRVLGEKK